MDLNTILSWFKRGCKPTEAQFAATFRSFRHKDDPVPMEDVTGLSYALANKSEKGHTHTLAEITDYDGGDKEVLNAMVANDTAELEAFTKTVGMYYILLADQTLYQYVHDEDTDTDTLTEVDPDGKVVYSAYDADNNLHIYLYNVPNMEFQDVTNEQVDKTIYTNDLDTLITRQLKNGIYSVVHINSGIDDNTYGDAYTLTVGDGSISSRVLECRSGWAQTVLIDESYQWEWHRYAYTGHKHQMSDVEGLLAALDDKADANHNHDATYAVKNHEHSQYLTQHQDISHKQDKTDNSLLTTAKNIVSAINELWNKFADYLKGIQHVTYAQLVTLRSNGELKPGQRYRITDFVTTVANDTEARSAGHPFDIIVVADDATTLNENARAIKHTGDSYFAGSKLAAWRIKYCLDNDVTRWHWADSENGKGVVYFLKDEFGNSGDFDFKNFQHKRYKVTDNSKDGVLGSLDGQYVGFDADMQDLIIDDYEDYIWAYPATLPSYSFNEESGELDLDMENQNDATLNLLPEGAAIDADGGGYAHPVIFCKGNKFTTHQIGVAIDEEWTYPQRVSDIVLFCYPKYFEGDDEIPARIEFENSADNIFAPDCDYITANGVFARNTFLTAYSNVIFGGSVGRSIFKGYCSCCTFGGYIGYTTFGGGLSGCTFGGYIWWSTFGGDIWNTTFGGYIYRSTFGGGISGCTFGGYIGNTTFGGYIERSTFGGNIVDVTFGGYIYGTTFGGEIYYTTFGGNIDSATFGGKAAAIIERYGTIEKLVTKIGCNSTANKRLREILQQVGITEHYTFHTARHTFATLLIQYGLAITTVQRLLGHQKIETTQIYGEITTKAISADIKRANRKHNQ